MKTRYGAAGNRNEQNGKKRLAIHLKTDKGRHVNGRLRHQHAEQTQGHDGDNLVRPDELNEVERRILKESFRQARKLQQRLKLDYQL